jgi:hypothetical protein
MSYNSITMLINLYFEVIVLNRVVMRQLSAWMGFVGTITIISGVISVATSFFTFTLGVIPGIITIFLGAKLRAARQFADELANAPYGADPTVPIDMLAANLNTYFKIQGVLIIIILVGFTLIISLGIMAGIAFLSRWG